MFWATGHITVSRSLIEIALSGNSSRLRRISHVAPKPCRTSSTFERMNELSTLNS